MIQSTIVKLLTVLFILGTSVAGIAQCEGFENYPEGIEAGKKVHVLYRDYMKQDKIEEAYKGWETIFAHAPAANEYHYVDGIKIYKHFADQAEEAEDNEKLEEYNTKVVNLYKGYLACYGEKTKRDGTKKAPFILGRMGRDMYYMSWGNNQETFDILQESIEAEGQNVYVYSVAPYIETAFTLYSEDLMDEAGIKKVYEDMLVTVEHNIETNEKYKAEFVEAKKEMEATFELYEANIYFADCEYWTKKLEPEFKAKPNTLTHYNEVGKKFLDNGCKNPFPRPYVAPKYTPIVKPTITLSVFQQEMNSAIGDYRTGNYAAARRAALKAAQEDPSSGQPYLLIGKMYAASSGKCGSTTWDKQVVVWPAIDMFEKAKRVDPSVAGEANKLISKYKKYMPDRELVFQKGLKEGQSYKVGCWIQTTTTIRATNQYGN